MFTALSTKVRGRLGSAGIIALAAAVVVGCSSSGGDADPSGTPTPDGMAIGSADPEAFGGEEAHAELVRLYEEAIGADQTQIVVYGASTASEPVWEYFGERFPGLTIANTRMPGSEIVAKVTQERVSGTHLGDVVWTGGSTGFAMDADGFFQPFPEQINIGDIPSESISPDATIRTVARTIYCIGYNSALVDESDAPSSWEDLTDPEWTGRITLKDPTINSPGLEGTARMVRSGQFDDEFWEALSAQDILINTDDDHGVTIIATGEREIAMIVPWSVTMAAKEDGAPVACRFPSDGIYLSDTQAGILENAPNELAAQLFLTWLATPDIAVPQNRIGQYNVLMSDTGELADGLPLGSEINAFPTFPYTAEEQAFLDSVIEQNRRLFG